MSGAAPGQVWITTRVTPPSMPSGPGPGPPGPGRLDRTISTMICISVCQITIGVAMAAAAESCSESSLLAASRLELAAWPARRVACGFPPRARRVTADRLAVTMTAPPQRQVPAGPPPLVPGPLGFAAGPCRGASPVSSGMSVQR
jgi:hypothetical protein